MSGPNTPACKTLNWPAYNKALKCRESLTIWFDPVVTDGARHYRNAMASKTYASVDHSKGEYVRGEVHTDNLEGFFSIQTRGLVGIYQHVDKTHLQRYLAEFDLRRNTRENLKINDTMRADILLQGFVGKRLAYQTAGARWQKNQRYQRPKAEADGCGTPRAICSNAT